MKSMNDDTDRFLLAAFLPADERRMLEREAGDDPLAAELMRASDALREALGEAAALRDDPGTPVALAYLAATRRFGAAGNTDWETLLTRLEERLVASPDARDAYRALGERIESLERESDAEVHFRRLTGQRPPRVLPLRSLLAAAAVVLAVAGTAFVGRLQEDPVARAAHEALRHASVRGLAFRGEDGVRESVRLRLLEARSLRFGLWPRYDIEAIDAARRELGLPRTAEDWLLVGASGLMAGDRISAQLALHQATRMSLDPTPRRLLEVLDREEDH